MTIPLVLIPASAGLRSSACGARLGTTRAGIAGTHVRIFFVGTFHVMLVGSVPFAMAFFVSLTFGAFQTLDLYRHPWPLSRSPSHTGLRILVVPPSDPDQMCRLVHVELRLPPEPAPRLL